MRKRSRFEIGRFVAVLIAAVLLAIIPLRNTVYRRTEETSKRIALYLDEFTSKARQNACISAEDYEKLLVFLDGLGFRYSAQIGIEREAESIALAARQVAAHKHGPECYAGHNHKACGCRYHYHSADCYCNGSFRTYSWYDPSTATCSNCYGRGKTGYVEVCPSCNGKEPDWEEVTCPFCDGAGEKYQDVWHICPTCNGAGCDICDEGKPGGWYKNELAECKACRGSGKVQEKISCSTCGGKGTVGEISTCTECNGTGTVSSDITHYKCDACQEGDSTNYGSACGRLLCGMDFESYECGIIKEDVTPRCDRIIVDAAYNENCTIKQFDAAETVDSLITFTCLNGSRLVQRAKLVNGPDSFDSSNPGTLDMRLSYAGYYERADNFETREFPIRINIISVTAECGNCGRSYYLNRDGSDPGCPYCIGEQFSIRVVVNSDVICGSNPDIDVFEVGASGEKKLESPEYEIFYDDSTPGEQQAAVFYRGIREYFVIRFIDENEGSPSETGITPADTGGAGITDPGEITGPAGTTGPREITGPAGITGSGEITGTPGVTVIPGIPIAPEITPTPEMTGSPGDSNSTFDGSDGSTINPDVIEDPDELVKGKYIFIPNDDIVSDIYSKGSYPLLPGDMLNISVYFQEGDSIKMFLKHFLIPDGIDKKYSSGIVI